MVWMFNVHTIYVCNISRFWAVSSPSVNLHFYNVGGRKMKVLNKIIVYLMIGLWADAAYTVLKRINN